MEELGRLTKVPLRKFWEDEEVDFTPWLAREKNISLLGKTIGLELEVEAQEKHVGPFRADILCKDISTDSWVLIENQLEPTNHIHLGQLLTYAAGLDAVTVIWIAESFTNEHRAALDWLNEITDEGFSFFGLEIELWRIGDSPMAPKFNMVSHPNDWTKTVSRISRAELTPTQELYFEYWTELRDLLEQRNGIINPVTARAQHWMYFYPFPNLSSDFWLSASVSRRGKWISVSLMLAGENGKPHFYLLKRDDVDIEEDIGDELEWDEKEGRKQNYISLSLEDTDLEDRQDWDRQHQWLREQLENFYRVFSPRVKELDASDYVPGRGRARRIDGKGAYKKKVQHTKRKPTLPPLAFPLLAGGTKGG